MSRRGRSDEPSLFDLPLVPEDEEEGPDAGAARHPRREVEPRRDVEGDRGGGGAGGLRAAPADAAADLAADPDLDQGLFALDPLAEDPAAGSAAGRAAAPHDLPASPEEAGFPFTDRPPPHRPTAPRPAVPQAGERPAEPRAASPSTARSSRPATAAPGDPADWDVALVDDAAAEPEEVSAPPAAAAGPVRAGLGPRLVAAAVDGAVLAFAAVSALVGAALLGVRPGPAGLPGVAALLLVFSFAYSVVPLAFWGATPGMRAARLVARDRAGGPLTFGQTAMRWLGGLLTLALAGLPMLLALGPLGARSAADRMSRSLTWLRR